MSKPKSKVKTLKTQNFLSSKVQKDAIYEIYRSCRLCGAGTGYKMPIVQNIIPIEDTEVELRTKIQECLQLQVQENDKMPPLICELCADKICDFYDFLIMCKQTNERTRMRLGLPMPVIRKEVIDLREPSVEIDTKETGKWSIKKAKEVKEVKKEIKKESRAEKELRDLIASNPVLSVPQRSRCSRTREDRKSPKESHLRPGPASSKLKRFREIVPNDMQSKKIKIEEPRSKRLSSVKVTEISKTIDIQKCDVCKMQFPKGKSFNNHYRIHKKVVTLVSKPQRETQDTKEETNFVGKCRKCGKLFEIHRTFVKHQAACRGGRVKIASSVRREMKPVQVRMIRCDSLLSEDDNGHYDVSDVRCPYGLDRSCFYPYNKNNSLLLCNRMVDIKFPEIPDAFDINDDIEEFLHWDSDDESDDNRREVESLSRLAIKVIFSDKFLGKIPKKRKKVKPFYQDFGLNIDRIISNLSETNESQSAFDNIKENWSDNVSDSILRNDNESDTFSVIGDLNDDTCSYTDTVNKEINYNTNDCGEPSKTNDTIETNKLEDERSSIGMLELNKKHNFDITETNTNNFTENCNLSPKITPSTDNNSVIEIQKCNNIGVAENLAASSSDKMSFEQTNNNVDNLNTLKSEIELLEIQIINDNDEEDCANRRTENVQNDDVITPDAISSEIEPNISAEILKTCESLVESICNETVPHNQDCEIAVENISIEEKTDSADKINENCVIGNINNDSINVNTETSGSNTENIDTSNTKNINVSFQAMEDTLKEITPNTNITNDYNKDSINDIIEPETSSQDSLSLPYFNINGKENIQNETQNTTDLNKIEDSTKSGNFEANSDKQPALDADDLDIYSELLENNILGNEIESAHRMGHKNNSIHKMNSNDLEDISDDEMDNENSNVILDGLLPDKSMDLDSISDGEFNLED
ncbi:uncharacterized protein LOC111000782 isoform X2 [Pieris rapae]|uniref:uncharacterized protein LOC111000782 isoform X2 n=1 Tax=Pieris rapae TaxID=64459 RepID=UPI001E27BBF1|nr:uncharacterized protein LOC111000782 isoform X2 [Pieris rapae]